MACETGGDEEAGSRSARDSLPHPTARIIAKTEAARAMLFLCINRTPCF
ncbi:MAG: hypothetical protein MZV63_65785 [Marinilabiliales bacterium]|nr:hypothetical protein [Marinilabiliales bacterium]